MARLLSGRVSSDKPNKSIIVSVATRKTHPIYKKQYMVHAKFMAHDENNEAKVGDLVVIRETRPISARKRFSLDKILEKAHAGFVETDATADVPAPEPPKATRPTKKKLAVDTKDESK